MASNVHVIGPEFLVEENARAFLRIEESVRQFSAHSREAIYLVRSPLDVPGDHFVLLWPHGSAVVGMFPYGGRIRGGWQGDWTIEAGNRNVSPSESPWRGLHVREERHLENLANPYMILRQARNELAEFMRKGGVEPETVEAERTVATLRNREAISSRNGHSHLPEVERTALVALFTGSVKELLVDHAADTPFLAMTVDEALLRSMVHIPNLLRIADIPEVSYSNVILARIAGELERSAHAQETIRKTQKTITNVPPGAIPARSEVPRWNRTLRWLIPLLLIAAGVAYFFLHSANAPVPPPPTAARHMPPPTPSEIIISTPVEAELFISPLLFQSRDQLDHALTYGEGVRFLPDTQQVVVMDSITLAKGVFGYFKVNNTWRKGKLLQTLQHTDTISVVRFLDPLP